LNVDAITIGWWIFVRDRRIGDKMFVHELHHVYQGRRLLYIGFWIAYLAQYLWGRVARQKSAFTAYQDITFEREARKVAADCREVETWMGVMGVEEVWDLDEA